MRAAILFECFCERFVNDAQMRDIRAGVNQLRFGQRALRPIGETGRFVDPGMGEIMGELLIGHAVAITRDHGGDLRIEAGRGDAAVEIPKDFEILPAGMEHFYNRWIAHQREKRRKVDARRERINQNVFLLARDLDQAELRIIGGLAQEFGVDGDIRMAGEAAACGRKRVGVGDHRHGEYMTFIGRGRA